jgi:carbonic anhydrase
MGSRDTARSPFAAAITCIDGRTHAPLVRWMQQNLDVEHVDLVTQPGADGALSSCPRAICDGLRESLGVSVVAHASGSVVIAGHDDCAANPVPAEVHRRHIVEAVRQVDGWGLGVEVIGVWIDRDGTVDRIEQTGTVPTD